jgi:CHAT domain-containing protein
VRRPRPLAWEALGLILLAAAPSPDPIPLRPGEPIERELSAGESQVFQIDLIPGRAWRVAVEQRGIDVVLSVSAPDGKPVTAVDSPLDRQGPETVLIEPSTPGSYRLEVRAHEPAVPPARYEIRIEEVDRQRLDAERAVTRAGERYLEGTAEARRQAIAETKKALAEWRTLEDRRQEARSLYALAVLSRLVNDSRPALAWGREVLPLWQSLGDHLWEGATWNEIGLDHWLLGESAEGKASFEKALGVQRQIGDRYGEGVSLSNLCLMDLARGELRSGLACYDKALPVLREVQAFSLEGSALLNVGRAYDVLGEPEPALDRYQQALERMKAIGDRSGEARTLNFLALLHQEVGEFQDALARFGQALDVFRALGDQRWQARELNNMGLVYQGLGEWSRAQSLYDPALRLWREVGDRTGEASTLTNLGLIQSAMGNPREALGFQQRALALSRETKDRWAEGVALTQLGRVWQALGDVPSALAAFDQAIALLHATGSRAEEAEAVRSRGETWVEKGEPAKGLASLEEALRLARSTQHRVAEAQIETMLALAHRRLGKLDEAQSHVEAALAIIDTLRTRIGSPDLRASYSAVRHRPYEIQLDLLMENHRAAPAAGFDRAALESSERARARTLIELLNEAGVDVRQGVDSTLLERRTSLLRRLSAKAERSWREPPKTADEKAALGEEQASILRDLDLVEGEIRERNPGYAALTRPQPLATGELQSLLDRDTFLLSYAFGEDRTFLWLVTPGTVESFELPGRKEIEEVARRVHHDLSNFDPAARLRESEDLAALGRMLLGPIAARLKGQRLVVVADGALQYIPFGVLPTPGVSDPLLLRHEIVYLPSISALAVQRRTLEHRPPAPQRLAVLADPVFDPRDPRVTGRSIGEKLRGAERGSPVFERLPASRREADAIAAIAALAPSGQVLEALDFQADRPLVLSDRLRAFRIVHFATHGVIDSEHPSLSGLALSMVDAAGRPQEGFLHLHDIYNLRLDADLVVLSGCRTALGKELRGEGLIGLTRGFQYAGAPRVVASLWRVEDQATAALMERFYRAMWVEGLRPAAALREAQLWVRQQRRWRDPWYWAGFVLAGDWT